MAESHGTLAAQTSPDPDVAESILITLSLAFIITSFSEQFGQAALPVSTLVTVLLATAFPKQLGQVSETAMTIGKVEPSLQGSVSHPLSE
eukprot:scaffold647868_cov30-Prasinocladus_malaysianus.AAC.1